MRSISKASLLVAVVAAAIAVVAPAAANAAVLKINGKPASAGQTIVGTSTNLWFQSSLGLQHCTKITVSAKVTRNDGSVVEAVENAPGTAEGCDVGGKATPTTPFLKAFKLEGTGTGTLGLELQKRIGEFECVFVSAGWPIKYAPGSNYLSITNMSFKAIPAACGPLTGNGGFTWTSAGGNVVFE